MASKKKKVMKIYRFSDGSTITDDIDGVMANQHVFCNPGIRCISVCDCCSDFTDFATITLDISESEVAKISSF